MGKPLRILLKVLVVIAVVILALPAALELMLNSKFVASKVTEIAQENIDADLGFSKLDISFVRNFPRVRVTADSVSLTYPHDRFSGYDLSSTGSPFESAGRGTDKDTLAGFDRFTASLNIMNVIGGRLRLSDASVSGLYVYAHRYDSTAANWDIFLKDSPKDTSAEASDLPWISLGEVLVDDTPTLYYTDKCNDLSARLSFDRFFLTGDARLGLKSGFYRFKEVGLDLDSLRLDCRMPLDTISAGVDALSIHSCDRFTFDTRLDAWAVGEFKDLGRYEVPIDLEGKLTFASQRGRTRIKFEDTNGNIAYIPFSITGGGDIIDGEMLLDLHLGVNDCNLSPILDKYAVNLVPSVADISTDSHLFMDVDAKGRLSKGRIPAIELALRLPDSHIGYEPADVRARYDIDISASMSETGVLDARVHRLDVDGEGLTASLAGDIYDVLGRWRADASLDASADLGRLKRFIPDSLGIDALGALFVNMQASMTRDEVKALRFGQSSLSGLIYADSLYVRMPDDSLELSAYGPKFNLGVDNLNLVSSLDIDALRLTSGDNASVRIRNMANYCSLHGVEQRGRTVPRLDLRTGGRNVSLRVGNEVAGLRNVNVEAGLQKRVRPEGNRRGRRAGSRRHPDSEADSDDNIRFSIDSSITKFLREWSPSGDIAVGGGFISSPNMPLRMRLRSFKGDFNSREINLDSLSLSIGTSDVKASGKLRGLLAVLNGRGRLSADMDISSRRLNLNELLVALERGRNVKVKEVVEDAEGDYVLDSIADAKATKKGLSLISIPGNLNLDVNLSADRVELSDLEINPLKANVSVFDHMARLTDAEMKTNVGDIALEAYYATKSRSDISLGADVHLIDMSSYDIIHMMPNVDSLLPALKQFEGKLGLDLSVSSQLDTNMNFIGRTLDAVLRIKGRDLMISDAGDLRRITRLLMFKNKNIGHIDDLSVDAVLHNGELEVFPFEIGVDRYRFALAGMQDMDQRLRYHISVMKSPFLIPFGINIYGYTDDWRYALGAARYLNGNVPVYTERLDAIQLNLVESIRNIYSIGVEQARDFVRRGNSAVKEEASADARLAEEMVAREADMDGVDSLAFALAMNDDEEQAELQAEVDAAMASCYEDFDKLIAESRSTSEDKGLIRRIKKLESKRKAKEN